MIHQELLAIAKPYKKNRRLVVGYGSTKRPGVDVPYMRPRGHWLRDAGFVIGRYVKIEVGEGRLLIEQPRSSAATGEPAPPSEHANGQAYPLLAWKYARPFSVRDQYASGFMAREFPTRSTSRFIVL